MNAPIDFSKLQRPIPYFESVRARPLLGTLVEVFASGSDAMQVEHALDCAFAAIGTVHALMSYQDENSEVSLLNREASHHEVKVNAHTWRVLRASQLMAQVSRGVFDVTVAPQLVSMGFLPQQANDRDRSLRGDWQDIILQGENTVRFQKNINIDLSGIAKGYAVDLAIKALQDGGMIAGRVNAGGDLRVFGRSAHAIHVRNPGVHTQTIPLLSINEGAAATSAGYYNERQYQGRMVLPIIDPYRGAACVSGRSVTVLAKDCMTADALTKVVYANPRIALSVLKAYKARALITAYDEISNSCQVFDSSSSEG